MFLIFLDDSQISKIKCWLAMWFKVNPHSTLGHLSIIMYGSLVTWRLKNLETSGSLLIHWYKTTVVMTVIYYYSEHNNCIYNSVWMSVYWFTYLYQNLSLFWCYPPFHNFTSVQRSILVEHMNHYVCYHHNSLLLVTITSHWMDFSSSSVYFCDMYIYYRCIYSICT